MTRVADCIGELLPWKRQPHNAPAPLLALDLRLSWITLLDCGVGQIEVGLYILSFGIEQGEDYMRDLCWNLEVL